MIESLFSEKKDISLYSLIVPSSISLDGNVCITNYDWSTVRQSKWMVRSVSSTCITSCHPISPGVCMCVCVCVSKWFPTLEGCRQRLTYSIEEKLSNTLFNRIDTLPHPPGTTVYIYTCMSACSIYIYKITTRSNTSCWLIIFLYSLL